MKSLSKPIIPPRQRLSPLQRDSQLHRGTTQTTLSDELGAGLVAFSRIREKGDNELWRLINVYAGLVTQLQVMDSGSSRLKKSKDFREVRSKLFIHAKKLDLFRDVSMAVGSLTQSIQYLIVNPSGEYANLAKQVISELDTAPAKPLGGSNYNISFTNPLVTLVFTLLTFRLLFGRSTIS